jgi:hypothetical protein
MPLSVKLTRWAGPLGSGRAYGSSALVERCVPGAAVAVSVVDLGAGPQALPAVGIVTRLPIPNRPR